MSCCLARQRQGCNVKLTRVKKLLQPKFIIAFAVLLGLVWLWPNYVHEPMHLAALAVQGIDGQIHFDNSYPPHPFTERTGQIQSVAGGLLFLLAPSLLSILLLSIIWLTRRSATIISHIILPAYLGMDLLVNVMGFRSPTDDFHFLIAFPTIVPNLIVGVVAILFITTIYINLHYLVHINNVSAKTA